MLKFQTNFNWMHLLKPLKIGFKFLLVGAQSMIHTSTQKNFFGVMKKTKMAA